MIPVYPDCTELTMALRPVLHPLLQKLAEGISEFTFANLYLFRNDHHYRISTVEDGLIILTGRDGDHPFFMTPFALPSSATLQMLFSAALSMKGVTESQADQLRTMGYRITEDRDNFDYLYRREDLALLNGRKFSRKRNQIKGFVNNYDYQGFPLLAKHVPAALDILEEWRTGRDNPGDYTAATEALKKMEALQLCGGIYYVDGQPAAYTLGEEVMRGRSFAIHFEKAVNAYKGVWQFVNQSFASILPEKYQIINREQDLGDEGLRAAKLSYKPIDFLKKYRVFSPDSLHGEAD